MKKIILFAAAAFLAVSCFQVNKNFTIGNRTLTGTGPVVSRELPLSGFDAIRLEGNPDVTFRQSDTFRVVLHTQENVIDSVDCRVDDGVLTVRTKGRRSIRATEFRLDIAAPLLSHVSVHGASDFNIPAGYRSEGDIAFEVKGSGDMDLKDIACGTLSILIQGAADANLEGLKVGKLKVTVQGAGDMTAAGSAGEADLDVQGAGDIDIRNLRVEGEIRKKTAGAAHIRL